jgi:hypothetical protein
MFTEAHVVSPYRSVMHDLLRKKRSTKALFWIRITLMRIRIRPITLMWIWMRIRIQIFIRMRIRIQIFIRMRIRIFI